MAEITRAAFTTPDGVERTMRLTKAAQFRMSLERQNTGALPDYFTAWAMMFDEDGNPPKLGGTHPRAGEPMTAAWLGENMSPLDTPRLQAAVAEAMTGNAVEKKIVDAMEKTAKAEAQRIAGLISGLSRESISVSEAVPPAQNGSSESSGGSRRRNSKHSASATPSASEHPTSEVA